jgi:signal transduction histidine kinase
VPVLALALVMSLTLSLVVTLTSRNSVLRRADASDLDPRVARLAGDASTDGSTSANVMAAGLREREALRAHNAALVADLQRQADELRDSRARIVAASVAARRQVERDLHDGAQQRLLLVGMKLAMARQCVEHDPSSAAAAIDEMREDLSAAIAQLRDLAHGIYPSLLENDGLPAALREAADRAAIPTTVDCDSTDGLAAELEAAVYFCCLEALQNVAKHGGAGVRARLRLTHRHGMLAFEVIDDGLGFDPVSTPMSAGLQNMTDRIGAFGGALRIMSAPGAGTTIAGAVAVAGTVTQR